MGLQALHEGETAWEAREPAGITADKSTEKTSQTAIAGCCLEGTACEAGPLPDLRCTDPEEVTRRPSSRLFEAARGDVAMPEVSRGGASDVADNGDPAHLISDIGEIFRGAARLEPPEIWFENSAYPREDELLFEVLEVLDAMSDPRPPGLAEMPYGMEWALDPAPLFLQIAS
jgi:hypothetical protein